MIIKSIYSNHGLAYKRTIKGIQELSAMSNMDKATYLLNTVDSVIDAHHNATGKLF